jgi:hypothetical protein
MAKAPVLDLGIEFAIRVAPSGGPAKKPGDVPSDVASQATSDGASEPGEAAAQERGVMVADDIAASDPKPSAELQTLAAEPHSPSATAQASRPPKKGAPGIEPLASALDAAVQLAADASVAAEALEKLKVLLQHKQQLDGLRSVQPVEHKQPFHAVRSTQPVIARASLGAEASASKADAILPMLPPPLPSPPLPVPAAEAWPDDCRICAVAGRRNLVLHCHDLAAFCCDGAATLDDIALSDVVQRLRMEPHLDATVTRTSSWDRRGGSPSFVPLVR